MISLLTGEAVTTVMHVQLREYLEAEWGSIDPFTGKHPEVAIPSPVVAVDQHASMAGGLIFGTHTKPGSVDIGVWINALLVLPTERKKGIGSRLVRSAETEARQLAITELFVLSEFPILYQKLGWQPVSLVSGGKETILRKRFTPS